MIEPKQNQAVIPENEPLCLPSCQDIHDLGKKEMIAIRVALILTPIMVFLTVIMINWLGGKV